MKKSQLLPGYLVELLDGSKLVVGFDKQGTVLAGENSYLPLSLYDDDLNMHRGRGSHQSDIVRVWGHPNILVINGIFDPNEEPCYRELLWHRKHHEVNKHEKKVLESLDVLGFKWLARDSDNSLTAFQEKPEVIVFEDVTKEHEWDVSGRKVYVDYNLFEFIQWKDEEPWNIQNMIERIRTQEGEQNENQSK